MISKRSAGGLVFARDDKGLYILLIRDVSGVLTFPKGIIEPGESQKQAAIREINEETSVVVSEPVGMLSPIGYAVGSKEHGYYKHVQYFVFIVAQMTTPIPQQKEGISEVSWVPYQTAYEKIGYPKTNKVLMQQACIVAGLEQYTKT